MKSITTPFVFIFCGAFFSINSMEAESIAPFVVNAGIVMEVSGDGYGRKTTLTIIGEDQKTIKISKKSNFIKFLEELPTDTLLRCGGFNGPSFARKKAKDDSGREYEYRDLFWKFSDGKVYLRDFRKHNDSVMTSFSITE